MDILEKKERRGGGGVMIFAAGAAVGAAAGLLLAPESGRENRRRLALWLKDKRTKGAETLTAKREQVAAALDAGGKAYHQKAKQLIGA